MSDSPTDARGFWQGPWRFRQAILATLLLVFAAWAVQVFWPQARVAISAGAESYYTAAGGVLAVILLQRLAGRTSLVAGLGSLPMAVTTVAAWALLTIPAAVWPQGMADPTKRPPAWLVEYGLGDVVRSLPFAVAFGLVLLNLNLAIAKRAWPWRSGTPRFLLVHGGLLVLLIAPVLGAGGVQRVKLAVPVGGDYEDMHSFDTSVKLPFALRLRQFKLDYYAPAILLAADADTDRPKWTSGDKLAAAGVSETIGRWEIRVAEFIPHAAVVHEAVVPAGNEYAPPAARLIVSERGSGREVNRGWVVAGTAASGAVPLWLTNDQVVVLDEPKPKLFESQVEIREGSTTRPAVIQVNKPAGAGGWWLYQVSYDSTPGQAPRYSVIEAVRDPALPGVYLGSLLLCLGCGWLLAEVRGKLTARAPAPQEVAV